MLRALRRNRPRDQQDEVSSEDAEGTGKAAPPVGKRSEDDQSEIIKLPPMQIIGKVMTASEFVDYVEHLDLPAPRANRVFLHHTWKPTPETWHGYDTILGMKAYYEQQIWTDLDGQVYEGWTVGPHIFVAPDGIWLFSDLRYDGVGVYGHNYRSRHIEMVGNYDYQLPSGSILDDTVAVLGILHERLGLSIEDLAFHRDFSTKTCPGLAVQKPWIKTMVREWIADYRRQREERMAAVRRAITDQVRHLLVERNPNCALSQAADDRGLVGPISQEIPIEIDDRAYLVQFYAEALLVPAPYWDNVQSLQEYEDMTWSLSKDQQGDDSGDSQVLLDMPPSPRDPFPYEDERKR